MYNVYKCILVKHDYGDFRRLFHCACAEKNSTFCIRRQSERLSDLWSVEAFCHRRHLDASHVMRLELTATGSSDCASGFSAQHLVFTLQQSRRYVALSGCICLLPSSALSRCSAYMTGRGTVNIAVKTAWGCIILAYSVIAWGSFVRDARAVASPCKRQR